MSLKAAHDETMGVVQAGPNPTVSDKGDTGSPLPLSHSASLSALLPGSEAAPADGSLPAEQQLPDKAAASSSSLQVCHSHEQTRKLAANIACASFGWQIVLRSGNQRMVYLCGDQDLWVCRLVRHWAQQVMSRAIVLRYKACSSALKHWRKSWQKARTLTDLGEDACWSEYACTPFANFLKHSLKRHPDSGWVHDMLMLPPTCHVLLCRDTAQAVAKQEIAELRRQNKREGLDLTYLKNVILGGFESGELSTRSSMLPVLARLLEFSPAELDRARKPKARA